MRSAADLLPEALALLDDLVGFDTVSSKSNLPLVERVEAYLRDRNIAVVRVPNAAGDKAALFATVGPETDGGLVLSGHTDVVTPAGQAWTGDPFALREADGRLFGRGTCDMKGFDALCLAALPHFRDLGLARPIHLLLSYDEEIGCQGSLDTIARFGTDLPRPAMALVGEPTGMVVVDAHKSIVAYKTTVYGKEAHSSQPTLGANAIEAGGALICELSRFQETLVAEGDSGGRFDPGYSTVHVGIVEGGTARNILARQCRLEWEFRGLPGVDQTRAIRHVEAFIARDLLPRLRRHAPEARVETHCGPAVPALSPDPGSDAERLVTQLAGQAGLETASYATEAGQFQVNGLSTVVCGPGSVRQAHQPDEYIERAQLEAGLALLGRLGEAFSA